MNVKNKGKLVVFCLCAFVLLGLVVFIARFVVKGNSWAFFSTNRHAYQNGEMTEIGEITDSSGIVLAHTKNDKRVYNADISVRKATLHAVGDSFGYIDTGAQTAFRERLTGYSAINGFYTFDGNPYNAQLTIDANVSVAAMKALGNFSGCVGVCNYKTGEVICMVSTPTFDIADEVAFKAAKNGVLGSVFVNRFISSTYTPGSTFKIVTSAAAIETYKENVYETVYNCQKGTFIQDELLSCVGHHNDISFERAFTFSCNSYFSQLGLSLGKTKMKQYAEIFGFNKTFYIDGIKAAESSYNVKDARNIELGWSSIGQYTDQMNPLQFLCAVSAIANDGVCVEPHFLKSIYTNDGTRVYTARPQFKRMLNENTADQLTELMEVTVANNYGKKRFPNLTVCGKTGTAEIGNNLENSLFVGFCKNAELPLSFVIVVEEGGSGDSSAISVASEVLMEAKKALLK